MRARRHGIEVTTMIAITGMDVRVSTCKKDWSEIDVANMARSLI